VTECDCSPGVAEKKISTNGPLNCTFIVPRRPDRRRLRSGSVLLSVTNSVLDMRTACGGGRLRRQAALRSN
jgi:hypothetical protein